MFPTTGYMVVHLTSKPLSFCKEVACILNQSPYVSEDLEINLCGTKDEIISGIRRVDKALAEAAIADVQDEFEDSDEFEDFHDEEHDEDEDEDEDDYEGEA